MPKERSKKRIPQHNAPVPLRKRQFAVQENAVEKTEIGQMADVAANEILSSISEAQPQAHVKKKEKQQLKHQALLDRLESTRSPYSKSTTRRLKRKARESLVTDMKDLGAAISELQSNHDEVEEQTGGEESRKSKPQPKAKPGQIGEGRHATLSKAQRKRALQTERVRLPRILSNPSFASNPFETIRTHARNTLLPADHLTSKS